MFFFILASRNDSSLSNYVSIRYSGIFRNAKGAKERDSKTTNINHEIIKKIDDVNYDLYMLANRDINQFKAIDKVSVDEYYTLLGSFIHYNADVESKVK